MYSLKSNPLYTFDTVTIEAVCLKYGLDPVGIDRRKTKNDRLYAKYGVDPIIPSTKLISTLEEEGFFNIVRNAFENLKKTICSKIPSEVTEAATLISSVGTDIIILCDFVIRVALPIIKTITNTTIVVNDYFNNHFLANFIPKTKLFSIISIPNSLYELVENIRKFVNALFDGVIRKIFLKASMGIASLSDICMSSAAFLDGLIALGKLTGEVVEHTSYSLSVLAVIFSLPSIILEGIKLASIKQFEQRVILDEIREFSLIVKDICKEKDKALVKHLGVSNGGLLKAQLNQIAKNNDKQANEEVVKTLKGRITLKKLCYVLKIVISLISIIACTILLFSTPVALLGYALIALVSALSISIFIIDKLANKSLEKTINKFVPDDSEEINKYLEKVRIEQWKMVGRKAARQEVREIIKWQPQDRFLRQEKGHTFLVN
jgi:hypothetical protein